MRIVRWAAAAATVLMSLMNLPFVVDDGGSDLPAAVRWLVSLLGVVGLVAAVGLVRRAPWGRPAVLAVGAVNLAGAVFALTQDVEGAAIGLVVSVLIVVLGFLSSDAAGLRAPASSPSVG